MRILFPTDKDEFLEAVYSVSSWDMAFPTEDIPFENDIHAADYFLGSSKDKKKWVLACMPYDPDDHDSDRFTQEAMISACAVALVDPPLVREESITKILLLVANEIRKAGRISEERVDEILNSVHFKEYFLAGSYLPELPEDWLHLPAELRVSFALSEGAGINHATFREYKRDSFDDALKMLCGPRQDGLMIHYSLVVQEVVPFLAWDVDWPLSRRGKCPPYRREKVQGPAPWEMEPNQKLLSVYQYLRRTGMWSMGPPYYGQPVVRLVVGGRSGEQAISNWHQCASALRKLRPPKA